MDYKTITLTHPIDRLDGLGLGSQKRPLTSLTFHRPTVGTLLALKDLAENDALGQLVIAIASMADLPESLVRELDVDDLSACEDAILPFFPVSKLPER